MKFVTASYSLVPTQLLTRSSKKPTFCSLSLYKYITAICQAVNPKTDIVIICLAENHDVSPSLLLIQNSVTPTTTRQSHVEPYSNWTFSIKNVSSPVCLSYAPIPSNPFSSFISYVIRSSPPLSEIRMSSPTNICISNALLL